MNGKFLTIVPKALEENHLQRAESTQFLVDGKALSGVVSATVHFRVDDVVTAEIELLTHMEGLFEVAPRYFIAHPESGQLVEVKSIVLADDTQLDFVCGD